MDELKIQSSKIKCGGCVANIEKGLTGFAGITEINVELESNFVNLKGSNLDKMSIENKLNELGYPVI